MKQLRFSLLSIFLVACLIVCITDFASANSNQNQVTSKTIINSEKSKRKSKPKRDRGSIIVYITKTGEKYHVGGCRYLSRSKYSITLREAINQGYDPCSVCGPPTMTVDIDETDDTSKAIPPGKRISGVLVRVVDGDTVRVKLNNEEYPVRLIGVDTPETVDPRKPVQYFGKEASDFTKILLPNGTNVILEPDQGNKLTIDKYQRLLAFIWREDDNLFVNLEIIKQGYGFYYSKYPFRQSYMDLFSKAEHEAKTNNRGLWR